MNTPLSPDPEFSKDDLQRGAPLFAWRAEDYHPHQRGILWIIVFCVIVFGSALALVLFSGESESGASILSDMKTGNIFMAITIFLAAAVYFYTHRRGDEDHEIVVYEKAIQIDKKTIPLKEVKGYWFIYEKDVSVINLELKEKKYRKERKIPIQMGEKTPEYFQENFERLLIPELLEKKEPILDKWIRILKL